MGLHLILNLLFICCGRQGASNMGLCAIALCHADSGDPPPPCYGIFQLKTFWAGPLNFKKWEIRSSLYKCVTCIRLVIFAHAAFIYAFLEANSCLMQFHLSLQSALQGSSLHMHGSCAHSVSAHVSLMRCYLHIDAVSGGQTGSGKTHSLLHQGRSVEEAPVKRGGSTAEGGRPKKRRVGKGRSTPWADTMRSSCTSHSALLPPARRDMEFVVEVVACHMRTR